MRRAELDHLARADEQNGLLRHRREDPLRHPDASRGHGDRVRADVGVRADLLGDGEGSLEELVQHRPQGAGVLGGADGLLQLAKDLRLAEHHRLQAARNAERVRHGLIPRQRVEVGFQLGGIDLVDGSQPLADLRGV